METKRWSWLFLLILVWPQWKAANLIRLISWKGNLKTGISKKKEFYKSVSPLQPVIQSTPELILKSLLFGRLSKEVQDLFGPWYLVFYATSLVSLAVEMTRSLVIGPCRILPEDLGWSSVPTFLCSLVPSFAILAVKVRLLWVLIEETEEEDMGRMAVIWAIFFILPQAVLALEVARAHEDEDEVRRGDVLLEHRDVVEIVDVRDPVVVVVHVNCN